MSHWIESPKVIDTTSGTTLLDLHGSLWDLLSVKELDSSLILQLRKYPGASNPIEIGLSIGKDGGTFNGKPLDGPGLIEALNNYS